MTTWSYPFSSEALPLTLSTHETLRCPERGIFDHIVFISNNINSRHFRNNFFTVCKSITFSPFKNGRKTSDSTVDTHNGYSVCVNLINPRDTQTGGETRCLTASRSEFLEITSMTQPTKKKTCFLIILATVMQWIQIKSWISWHHRTQPKATTKSDPSCAGLRQASRATFLPEHLARNTPAASSRVQLASGNSPHACVTLPFQRLSREDAALEVGILGSSKNVSPQLGMLKPVIPQGAVCLSLLRNR